MFHDIYDCDNHPALLNDDDSLSGFIDDIEITRWSTRSDKLTLYFEADDIISYWGFELIVHVISEWPLLESGLTV